MYVRSVDWSVDVAQLHADFCNQAGISQHVLTSALAQHGSGSLFDSVQGHDLLRVVDIGLKGLLKGTRSCGEHELRSKLRMAVQTNHLTAASMCVKLELIASGFSLPKLVL